MIGTNNLRTDYHDTKTTGIYLGNSGPTLKIALSGNVIKHNASASSRPARSP